MKFFYIKDDLYSGLIDATKISGVIEMGSGIRVYFTGGKEDFIDLHTSLEVFSEHLKSVGATIKL